MNVEIITKQDYLLVERVTGASDMVVYFAPVGVPADVHVGQRVLRALFAHRIYVNCANNQWYLDGITGLGNFSESIDYLRNLIGMLIAPHGKLITFGGSMGGFGSVAYGCSLNADVAIGQGVEYILKIPGGASEGHLANRSCEDFDIFQLVKNSQTIIYNYVGEGSITDCYCALEVANRSSKEAIINYSIRGLLHTLPNYIEKKYGIANIVNSALNGRFYTLDETDKGILFDFPELINACFHLHESTLKNDPSYKIHIHTIEKWLVSTSAPDEIKSFAYHHLAIAASRLGTKSSAIINAEKAFSLAPHFFWNSATAIKICDQFDELQNIDSYIEQFLKLQDHTTFIRDLDSTYCAAKYFTFCKQEYILAIRLCQEILRAAPDHDVTWELSQTIINLIFLGLKNKDVSFFLGLNFNLSDNV